MRGGSCGVVDASLAATETASSVGAGATTGAGSGAGSGWTASAIGGAGSLDGVVSTGGAAGGLGLRLGVARLATGAGGGGISVSVAESIGRGSDAAADGCGSAAMIRCASSDAMRAPARTPRGCERIQDAILVTPMG